MTKIELWCIIYKLLEAADLEWYRRGHNEHDWKSCDGQKPSEGSNPSHSAIIDKLPAKLVDFFLSTQGVLIREGIVSCQKQENVTYADWLPDV